MGRRSVALAVTAVAFGCGFVTSLAVAYKQPAAWRHLPGIGLPKEIRCCFRYDLGLYGTLSADFGQAADADNHGQYRLEWGLRQRGIDLFVRYHSPHSALLFPLDRTEESHQLIESDDVQRRRQSSTDGSFYYTPETTAFRCEPALTVLHPFQPVPRSLLSPLLYWSGSTSSGTIQQFDTRTFPELCASYFSVNGIGGPLYGDPKWTEGYGIRGFSFDWGVNGTGSRRLECTASQYAPQGSGVNAWQFKGAREAYVRVTYFPYSQLPQYERTLAKQRGTHPDGNLPEGWSPAPFLDIGRNPSAPFGPNNPPNGCHPG